MLKKSKSKALGDKKLITSPFTVLRYRIWKQRVDEVWSSARDIEKQQKPKGLGLNSLLCNSETKFSAYWMNFYLVYIVYYSFYKLDGLKYLTIIDFGGLEFRTFKPFSRLLYYDASILYTIIDPKLLSTFYV